MLLRVMLWVGLILPSIVLEGQQFSDHYQTKSIFFGGGSWYVDEQQRQDLLDWIDRIENLHEFDIMIHSHTDNIGSVEYNARLSRMRSEAVFQILIGHGIPADWIYIRDFGEFEPDFSNEELLGRLKNRRVDVILVPPPT